MNLSNDLQELMMGPIEDLDPELAARKYVNDLGWTCIKHPLYISIMHIDQLNAIANRALREKRKAAEQYLKEKEWTGYIWIHERPFRLEALLRVIRDVPDDERGELVQSVWMDSENIREFPDEWAAILNGEYGTIKYGLMDEDEAAELAAMPETITIYQGCTDERDDGWSWTTRRDKAEWFAHYFAGPEHANPVLRVGRVERDKVLAYWTGRNEHEIVVDPIYVVVNMERDLVLRKEMMTSNVD